MTGDLRRVTALLASPAKAFLQLSLLLIAESLDPVLNAFALRGLLDAFVALNAPLVWRAALLFLAVMVFRALTGGAGVSVRVSLVEQLARRQREALLRAGVETPSSVREDCPGRSGIQVDTGYCRLLTGHYRMLSPG